MDPHLKKLQLEIAAAVEGMPLEQMSWHPPGKWCAAEVLEHLYLTYTGTVKGFERVLEAGKPLATKATWSQRVGALVVVGFSYFPAGREAPTTVRPRGLPPEKVRAEIGLRIAEMDEIMRRCEDQFGAGKKVLDHPILGPFNVAQWRKFHLVHGRHHVKQILRLQKNSVR